MAILGTSLHGGSQRCVLVREEGGVRVVAGTLAGIDVDGISAVGRGVVAKGSTRD